MESRNVNICSACGVAVDAALKRCPLCKRSLALSSGENELYPPLVKEEKTRRRSLTGDLFVFLTVLILMGCALLNTLFWNGTLWFAAVAAVTFYIWILVRFTIFSDMYGGFKIGLQMIGIIFMLLSFDYTSGWHGWSLNTGIPLTLAGGLLMLDYFAYIHKTRWKDNLFCAVFYTAACFAPAALYFSGVTIEPAPAIVAAAAAGVTIAGIARFTVRRFKAEMGKRFHI